MEIELQCNLIERLIWETEEWGSDLALPQSELWNGVQDEVENKQYGDNGGHLGRVYNKHDCGRPQHKNCYVLSTKHNNS